jgi:plasmid stabilization system protein ParE
MGKRKVVVRESAAKNIAEIAWYIESKGMVATAEKFADEAYDFIAHLADDRVVYSLCKEPLRNLLGQKCKTFKKKYTIVFYEDEETITVCEFIPSKLVIW